MRTIRWLLKWGLIWMLVYALVPVLLHGAGYSSPW